ncbi:MAG: Hpt domain-containing protein, partial [Pirellulales bacterium]|nr:Hpt domain-containing protein [Pirellulales bacterium]
MELNGPSENTIDLEDFSIEESRELLDEVRQATCPDAQPELHGFASLLGQLLDLHRQDRSGGAAEFIAQSVAEIRAVVSADRSTSSRLEELFAQAIEHWGDQLTLPEEHGGGDACGGLQPWGEEGELDADSDGEPIAPSAAEIQSLLSQLGGAASSSHAEDTGPADGSTPTPSTSTQPPQREAATAQPPSLSIESLDVELREAFMDDASNCVSSMEEALLKLESSPEDSESLNQICRELHTLKGA